MIRHCQPVMKRGFRFQDDVTAFLVDLAVIVMFAEQLD